MYIHSCTYFKLHAFCFYSSTTFNNETDPMVALLDHVTSWYQSRGPNSIYSRPAPAPDKPTLMMYSVHLHQLMELNIKDQAITASFWIYQVSLGLARVLSGIISQRLLCGPESVNSLRLLSGPENTCE